MLGGGCQGQPEEPCAGCQGCSASADHVKVWQSKCGSQNVAVKEWQSECGTPVPSPFRPWPWIFHSLYTPPHHANTTPFLCPTCLSPATTPRPRVPSDGSSCRRCLPAFTSNIVPSCCRQAVRSAVAHDRANTWTAHASARSLSRHIHIQFQLPARRQPPSTAAFAMPISNASPVLPSHQLQLA